MRNPLSRPPADAAEPVGPPDAPQRASPQAARDDAEGDRAAPSCAVGFGAYLRYFLGLGTWGFGGPIASVGYMQRHLSSGGAG